MARNKLSGVGILTLVIFLGILVTPGRSQTSVDDKPGLLAQAAALYAKDDWQQLLRLIPETSSLPARLDFYRGMALARLGRSQEARQVLQRGATKDPLDKHFPLELAGLAFQSHNTAAAKAHLRRALALDPEDRYAHEFLATLFFLEENWEAALIHWNEVGKPVIETIDSIPSPRLEVGILDQVLRFAPTSLLRIRDYRDTRALLDFQGIFPAYRFELVPRPDSRFDLQFHPVERNGLGERFLAGLFYGFRGIPARTVYLEAFNLKAEALNSRSLFRWHPQKRRLFSSLSGIWRDDPHWRYSLMADWRKENWDLSRTYQGDGTTETGLNLQSYRGGAEIQKQVSSDWSWRMGVEVAHRRYRDVLVISPQTANLFVDGTSLKYVIGVDHCLLLVPERRLDITSSTALDTSKLFSDFPATYTRIQSDIRLHWFPRPSGNDDAVMIRLRAGASLGSPPFDELFMLGMERENDLALRGHAISHQGKKGDSYLGKHYVLLNSEFDKRVFSWPFMEFSAGPLLDIGRTFDAPERFAFPGWLWDVGIQTKVRLRTGSSIIFSYGRDLQAGQHAFFLNFSR
jgi:hypothetical protein